MSMSKAANASRRSKKSRPKIAGAVLTYIVLTVLSVFFIGPLLWLLSTSLMTDTQNPFSIPPTFIPHPMTLNNYVFALTHDAMARDLLNSLIVAVVGVAASLFINLLTAYPFAFLQFPYKKSIFLMMAITFVVPAGGLIPTFVMLSDMHLTNSWFGLWFIGLFSPFTMFLFRQAFLTLGKTIHEAGMIDGASEMRMFIKIFIPLIAPTVATFGIIGFLGSWDSYMMPFVLLNSSSLFTAPLALSFFQSSFGASFQVIAAAEVLVAAPIVIIFLSLQRYYVNGLAGAIKA